LFSYQTALGIITVHSVVKFKLLSFSRETM